MNLESYAKTTINKASQLNHYASDVFLANDDLVRPFKRLSDMKAELQKLRHDVVFDQTLKPKLTELEKVIAQNEEILDKLGAECTGQGMTDKFCLAALIEQRRFASEQIELEIARFADKTRDIRQAASVLRDSRLAESNPKYQAAKKDHDQRISELRAEYAKLDDNIDALRSILKSFIW